MFDGKAFGEEVVGIVREHVERTVAPLIARIKDLESRTAPKDGVGIVKVFKDHTGALIITLSDGQAIDTGIRDGKDGEPGKPGNDGEPGVAGKDADAEQIVEAVLERIPKPQDGKSMTPDDVRPMLEEMIAALPPAPAGKNADPDEIERMISEAVAALPKPADGKSVTVDELRPFVEEIVAKAVEKIPVAKDGVGLAGGMIDRDGNLILTLTDGTQRELGRVEGKDGEPGEPGLGFEDIEITHDGERGFTFRMERDGETKEFSFSLPVVIDRGVWREGSEYEAGDGVTWDGSFWIARAETKLRPGGNDDWRQAAKKGRDGKSVRLDDVKPMIDRAVDLAVKGLTASKAEK